jgi:hypothetical protein
VLDLDGNSIESDVRNDAIQTLQRTRSAVTAAASRLRLATTMQPPRQLSPCFLLAPPSAPPAVGGGAFAQAVRTSPSLRSLGESARLP